MHLPLLPVLVALTTLLPSVLGDFHIVTANCLDYEFSKRSEIGTGADPEDSTSIEARDAKGGGGGDTPANWHLEGRSTRVNLIPSQNYGDRCNYIAHHENLSLETLPGDYFQASGFCRENLDFYKTNRDTWEVYRHNANPGVKFGECYRDTSTFQCDLLVGLYKSQCNWTRQYVCPMSLCK